MHKIAKRGSARAEKGETRRTSHLLRVAKVVCQSGEYPCLIRDVSAEDVSLRFFHKVVPERRIILEQGNGATWPIERNWAQGAEAGYRFACHVDVDAFTTELSPYADRAIRLRMERPAMAAVAGQLHHATLLDLSASGARLEAETEWPVRSLVRVAIEGFPLRFGHVSWRRGLQHGINFQGVMPLDEFARSVRDIQPFHPASGKARMRDWTTRAA
ncbi:MAG: hypothetical protein R3E18_08505 [Sphingomonadaceae bacterium]|nr:PilZ domain-containing protein [Sphingomonadaceae bacterium]